MVAVARTGLAWLHLGPSGAMCAKTTLDVNQVAN